MDANASAELNSIERELRSIIKELEDISCGVSRDFVGIGNKQCSAAIDMVVSNYYSVQKKLSNIDTVTVTESFGHAHGGGIR